MLRAGPIVAAAALLAGGTHGAWTAPADLALVPYPRQVRLLPGTMRLGPALRLTATRSGVCEQAATDVAAEVRLAAGSRVALGAAAPPPAAGTAPFTLALSSGRTAAHQSAAPAAPPGDPEGYTLSVRPSGALVAARAEQGLARGAATLCQLIRANSRGGRIPCVSIVDYPALRYRGFMDDITRGPSPRLATLQREARMAAYLRMSFLTYYLEHQYQFRKHPDIGPAGGSLLPQELSALVEDATRRGVEVIGCQQSFGHFYNILKHPAYASLRETPDVIDPTNERTYRLLDDLYSEQAPLTRSPFFIVCCDETYGLGTGPSKALAARIGAGGVYARHVTRLHDLLRDRYGKRMMMWGDIILQHPDHLSEVPRDAVMLSWGYDARASFDDSILPFTRAGYDFLVCPGTSNWSRILPDFGTAATNIHNYVRDGVRHGAMGALTTTWNDDGETLFAPNWYSLAWAAECAWTGSRTSQADFDRRVGAVLFGERQGHFGRAVALLARTHRLPGYGGMMDSQFWQEASQGPIVSREALARQARELLAVVEPAIRELRTTRRAARTSADVLDHFLFGAERMRLIATRSLATLRAADSYRAACDGTSDAPARRRALAQAASAVEGVRAGYARLRADHARLWLAEKRSYALDAVLARYDAVSARWARLQVGLEHARGALDAGKPLPEPSALGLALAEAGVRRTAPAHIVAQPLQPDAPWAVPDLPGRVGITVGAGHRDRVDLPVEVDVPAAVGSCRLVRIDAGTGRQDPVTCQIVPGTPPRLAFLAEGRMAAGTVRTYVLYWGARARAPGRTALTRSRRAPAPSRKALTPGRTALTPGRTALTPDPSPNPGRGESVSDGRAPGRHSDSPFSQDWEKGAGGMRASEAPRGMKRIDNGPLRLLIGPEGGHIYRWEVKALGGRDLTEPGETDWQGFADITGASRRAQNRIEVLAAGPVLVRLRCTDPTGLRKTFDVWAGVPWVECRLDAPSTWFACYDDIGVMGAASPTPGRWLFSNGETGPLHPTSASLECQEARDGQRWCAKYVPGGPLLALLTPEATPRHMVGPGGGMGGVVVEGGPATAHFVIYGGPCPKSPGATLDLLCGSLDYTHPADVTLSAVQRR